MKCEKVHNCDITTCKVSYLFSFISKKWVLLILKALNEWCYSFTEIKRHIWEVNSKIISQRLDELKEEWFIDRKIVSEKPIKIRYCLTKKWESFSKEINRMWEWAEEWIK